MWLFYKMGLTASCPGLHTPAAFFRAQLGQFSMCMPSTANVLMRRIPPSARTAVCAQLGTSRTQNKFCTSQQYRFAPCTSLWALGKESSWEEAAGARKHFLQLDLNHLFPHPMFSWVGTASRRGWMESLGGSNPVLAGDLPSGSLEAQAPLRKGLVSLCQRKG